MVDPLQLNLVIDIDHILMVLKKLSLVPDGVKMSEKNVVGHSQLVKTMKQPSARTLQFQPTATPHR